MLSFGETTAEYKWKWESVVYRINETVSFADDDEEDDDSNGEEEEEEEVDDDDSGGATHT